MSHTLFLQALGINQDEPFTLDKGMKQLRSLRRGSKKQDPAGIMMQIKDFAKVCASCGCHSLFFALIERVDLSLVLMYYTGPWTNLASAPTLFPL